RINPEFEHAARAMERTRHAPFAIELADVAQVDEHDVVIPAQRKRVAGGQRLDLALRRRDERIDMSGNVLRHGRNDGGPGAKPRSRPHYRMLIIGGGNALRSFPAAPPRPPRSRWRQSRSAR